MTKKHDETVKDEATAEQRYQAGLKSKAGPPPSTRVPVIDLSPLAEDAPPAGTPFVQASLADPETKKLFTALVEEIRRQVAGGGGGGGGGTGGVSQADFDALKASVKTDLNALRDSIMLTNASLDADTGVATETYAENGDPPPLVTQ